MNPKPPEIRYHSQEFGSSIPVVGMSPGHKLELNKIEFENSCGKKKNKKINNSASDPTVVIMVALD